MTTLIPKHEQLGTSINRTISEKLAQLPNQGDFADFAAMETYAEALTSPSDLAVKPQDTVRTLTSKLRDVVSVLDFGAVADGNIATGAGTDNSAFFQTAIDTLGAGGVLYVPAGIYKLSSQITVPSNFTITGANTWQTFLLAPTAFNSDGLIKLNGAGGPPTTIQNLAVGGQQGGAGAASIGILSDANGVFLRNLWVTGFFTNIKITDGGDNFILDSVIEETIAGGIGIAVTGTDVTIGNCETYNCYVGIGIGQFPYVNGTVTITGVRSLDCSYAGFIIDQASNIQISNCSVGSADANKYTYAGMYITGSSNVVVDSFVARLAIDSVAGLGIYSDSSTDINISNSQITNFYDGIKSVNDDNILINGNTCNNNVRRGIYVASATTASITNNQCLAQGTGASTDAGIYADNTVAYGLFNIVGNLCSQNGGGAQDYGVYANLTNNGATSGFTNIVGNMVKFNAVANISVNGLTANITQTGNVS